MHLILSVSCPSILPQSGQRASYIFCSLNWVAKFKINFTRVAAHGQSKVTNILYVNHFWLVTYISSNHLFTFILNNIFGLLVYLSNK